MILKKYDERGIKKGEKKCLFTNINRVPHRAGHEFFDALSGTSKNASNITSCNGVKANDNDNKRLCIKCVYFIFHYLNEL